MMLTSPTMVAFSTYTATSDLVNLDIEYGIIERVAKTIKGDAVPGGVYTTSW